MKERVARLEKRHPPRGEPIEIVIRHMIVDRNPDGSGVPVPTGEVRERRVVLP